MNLKEPFKASFADGMDFLSELLLNSKGNYGVIAVEILSPADLVTFTEEILNGILLFLCSVYH